MTRERVHTGAARALRISCVLHLLTLLALTIFFFASHSTDSYDPHDTAFDLAFISGLIVPPLLLVLYLVTLFTSPPRRPGSFRWTNGVTFTGWLILAVVLSFVCLGSMGLGGHLG